MFSQSESKAVPRMLRSSAMIAENLQAVESKSAITDLTETKEREEKHQHIDPDKLIMEIKLDTFKCPLTNSFYMNPVELSCGHVFESSALPNAAHFNCYTCQESMDRSSVTPVRNIIFWKTYQEIFNQYPQLNKLRYYSIEDFYKILINSVDYSGLSELKLNDNRIRFNQYAQLFVNATDLIFQPGKIDGGAEPINAAYLFSNLFQDKQFLNKYPQLKAIVKSGSKSGAALMINPLNAEAAKLVEYLASFKVKQDIYLQKLIIQNCIKAPKFSIFTNPLDSIDEQLNRLQSASSSLIVNR